MELVAGCYEQVLFGFSVLPGPAAGGEQAAWTPVADFTHHAHIASLSAVAVSGRFVVTGSKDETIHIYDMKKKLDHGALVHHSGTITCLKFHGNRHLLSGAEDGLICVWDAKKWECLKSLRAHRGHVTFLSIHPSGKLALSVGTDKTLRTWNLVEGRSAFVKNIKQNAHIVEWSPSGEKYVVVVLNKIDVYQLASASVSGSITSGRRVSAVAFLSESVLAVAGDEEIVRVFDCDSQLLLCEWRAHENRVKDMCSLEILGQRVLVTASSDGFIKVWQLSSDMKVPPALLCEVRTNARLTCVGVWLDDTVGTGAGRSPSAEPSLVSRKQSEVGWEEEQCSEPNVKKRDHKAVCGDGLGLAKRRKPMEELEKSNSQSATGKDGLQSAQQEAAETPGNRTRKPASGDAGLRSVKRRKPMEELEKSNSQSATGKDGLQSAQQEAAETPGNRTRKPASGDAGLRSVKRRKPMEELEKSNSQSATGKDGLQSAQQEAAETPGNRTRKQASGDAGLRSAKRKRVKKLEKRDSKPARGGSLGTATKRKEQGL